MDEATKELTDYYHLKRYEISNYAKEGFECRHNLGYWSDVPYIGFGLNASSYFLNNRYKNKLHLADYMSLNYKNYMLSPDISNYYDELNVIDEKNHINEYVMLGFRKTSGINTEEFYNVFNKVFDELYKNEIKYYQSMELLYKKDSNYYLSDKGLDISNKIIADFIK